MAQQAIIHTATRVIRRVTIDARPTVGADETAVPVVPEIDLAPAGSASGYWKLDGANVKVAATQDEGRTAGLDAAHERTQRANRRQALLDHLDDMASDLTLPAKVRTFADRLRKVF